MKDRERAEGEVLARSADGVAWITLQRPERLNAFVGQMREQLAGALAAASDDPSTRVIVITGAGRAFCAGADVDAMAELLEREDEDAFRELVRAGMRVVRRIRAARQPVIAALNGVAAGAGASLAAACDLRVAAREASVGFTFNRIGLHPDWGATYFLPRLVGPGRAAELIHSARMVGAEEGASIGLIDRIAAPESLAEAAASLAAELASKPPLALALAKRSLAGDDAELEAALRREEEAQLACFRSRDVREGIAAFREKRRPVFRGA